MHTTVYPLLENLKLYVLSIHSIMAFITYCKAGNFHGHVTYADFHNLSILIL